MHECPAYMTYCDCDGKDHHMDWADASKSFEAIPVLKGGKRLGIRWTPWMGDWFVSWSPRNDNEHAEGQWFQWAHLAAAILSHPMTRAVAPDLYRDDLPVRRDLYTDADKEMAEQEIADYVSRDPRRQT